MNAPAGLKAPSASDAAASWARALSTCLAAPFDATRLAYGAAVQLGLAPRSMLASREIERALDALEHAALGPFARHA